MMLVMRIQAQRFGKPTENTTKGKFIWNVCRLRVHCTVCTQVDSDTGIRIYTQCTHIQTRSHGNVYVSDGEHHISFTHSTQRYMR